MRSCAAALAPIEKVWLQPATSHLSLATPQAIAAAAAPPPLPPPPAVLTFDAVLAAARHLIASLDVQPAAALPPQSALAPRAAAPAVALTPLHKPAIYADRPRTVPPEDGPGAAMVVCAQSERRYHLACLAPQEVLQVRLLPRSSQARKFQGLESKAIHSGCLNLLVCTCVRI